MNDRTFHDLRNSVNFVMRVVQDYKSFLLTFLLFTDKIVKIFKKNLVVILI